MTLHHCTVCDQVHSSEAASCPSRGVLVSGTTCECECCRHGAAAARAAVDEWRTAANSPDGTRSAQFLILRPCDLSAHLHSQVAFALKLIAERDSALAQIAALQNKLRQRNESLAKLNAYIGWNATDACSGDDGCWCDAHAGKRVGS